MTTLEFHNLLQPKPQRIAPGISEIIATFCFYLSSPPPLQTHLIKKNREVEKGNTKMSQEIIIQY